MESTLINRKCVNGFTLKLIAVITMTIDHTAAVLGCGGLYWPMRGIGRIAFPIYCFLLVEGYFHTHSVKKYTIRLLIAAVVSELPFDLAFNRYFPAWGYQNVMLTLAIGLLTVCLVDHSRRWAEKLCSNTAVQRALWIIMDAAFILAGMWLAELCQTDYSGGGVALILVCYFFRKRPALLCVSALAVLWGFFGGLEAIGIVAMLPILLYNGQRGPAPGGKLGQYFFYAYYPLHLGILVLIRLIQ